MKVFTIYLYLSVYQLIFKIKRDTILFSFTMKTIDDTFTIIN